MNLSQVNYEANKHGGGDFTKVLAQTPDGKYFDVSGITMYKGLTGIKADPELEMQGQKCIILSLKPVEVP